MGNLDVAHGPRDVDPQAFMQALLADLQALEQILDEGRIERGRRRIGAEQEMFLVDRGMRPKPVALQVLAEADDPRLTGELALFNLEANLSPQELTGSCFKALRGELEDVLARARALARAQGADILLAGILPTLKLADLGYENMTPEPRYFELDRAIREERGGDFEVNIRGLDELEITHGNVMLEACNTSLQLHLQVDPDDLCAQYNLAQLITAPVLAAAVNSPTLLGRRLWSETRVALFESSVDSRRSNRRQKGEHPRVYFGERWLERSPLEIFREDISRFRPIIRCSELPPDPLELLERGELPRLAALSLHSGTVYRWNRICYGLADGVAHLRIENRSLPSGPSITDEVANAAFFFGLMVGLADELRDLHRRLRFDDAKANFFRAARHGLDAQLRWVDGKSHPAARLILDVLLPAAARGLASVGVDADDAAHYLGVIEARVRTERTGAQWAIDSLVAMEAEGENASEVRCRALVQGMIDGQASGAPVAEWPLAEVRPDEEPWRQSYATVGQIMTTELFSVRGHDIVDLAAHLMDWHQVRHVPVEGAEGELEGLISHRAMMRVFTQRRGRERSLLVRDVMRRDPVTVQPVTSTLRAMQLMREHRISALPVIEGGKLVGLVTERDLIRVSTRLLERFLAPLDAEASGRGSGTLGPATSLPVLETEAPSPPQETEAPPRARETEAPGVPVRETEAPPVRETEGPVPARETEAPPGSLRETEASAPLRESEASADPDSFGARVADGEEAEVATPGPRHGKVAEGCVGKA